MRLRVLLAVVITGNRRLAPGQSGVQTAGKALAGRLGNAPRGIGFLVIERWLSGRNPQDRVTWTVAVAVGIGQLLAAVFPGTSRSGATILLMLMLGLSRPAATSFPFSSGFPRCLQQGAEDLSGAPSPGSRGCP